MFSSSSSYVHLSENFGFLCAFSLLNLMGFFCFCVFLCLLYFEVGIEAGSHCGLE